MSDNIVVEHSEGGRIFLRRLRAEGVSGGDIDWFQDEAFSEFLGSGGISSGNNGSIKAYTCADWVIEATMKGNHLINGEPQVG